MAIRLISAATIDPVTLAEAKLHLRVDVNDDDSLISRLISAVVAHISDGKNGWLGRALITQTWELLLDQFPCNEIRLPLPPLQSVTSVKYVDEDGVTQTVAAADYQVDIVSEPGWVVPTLDVSWPTPMTTINAVTIRYICGYGPATTDVPAAIRQAILLMVGDLYAFRETGQVGSVSSQINMTPTVEALLMPYRRGEIF